MTKLTPPKFIRVANGGRMRFGQIIGGSDTMQKNVQRPLNSSINPRQGAPKITPTPEPAHGQRSRIAPSHPFNHGAPLDDLPNTPLKSHEKPIGFHSGMTDKQIIGVANSGTAGQVLDEASNLGRKSKPPMKA